MRTWDFWIDSPVAALEGHQVLNEGLLRSILAGPVPDHSEVEVGAALCRFTAEQFEAYGTSGNRDVSDDESGLLVLALKAVLSRLGITGFDPPWRDFRTFERFWRAHDGIGSWQARRDMVDAAFEPTRALLDEREAGSIQSSLANPISPRPTTGWATVDAEIAELRRHFESAVTQQDYSNVGNDAVAVLEALSAVAYDHAKHQIAGGAAEPPVSSTKERLDRVIEVEMPGSENAPLRKLARASIEMAQAVKHRRATVNRRDAGVAADAVILLTNILRRIGQP